MNRVVIFNLRKLGDILYTARLVDSLRAEKDCHISLVCYKESLKAAQVLEGIDSVIPIDRKAIATTHKAPFFGESYSFNYFLKETREIRETNWDQAINISNDNVSTYLCTYLYEKYRTKISGIFKDRKNKVRTNNEAFSLINDYSSQNKSSIGVHNLDLYRMGLNLKKSLPEHVGFKTLRQYRDQVEESFSSIREHEQQKTNIRPKLVAIQAFAGTKAKSFDQDFVSDLIEQFFDDPGYLPILLHSKAKEEVALANILNERFDNELVCVESDFWALSPVIKNIDMLVTPDTSVMHMGDAIGTPIISIFRSWANLCRQFPRSSSSISIFDPNSKTSAKDVYYLCGKVFDDLEVPLSSFTPDIDVFESIDDELGKTLRPIKVSRTESYIDYVLEHIFIAKKLGINIVGRDLGSALEVVGHDLVRELLNNELRSLTKASSLLLQTLRNLIAYNKNGQHTLSDFFNGLSKIHGIADQSDRAGTAASLFVAKLESLAGSDQETMLKTIEALLYELKSDLQLAQTTIEEFRESTISAPSKGRNQRISVEI